MERRATIVTGATGAIGKAIARQLAAVPGYEVTLIGRDEARTRQAVGDIVRDTGSERVRYEVTTGTQPVWNGDGEPIASVFYTYYERIGVEDRARRPLTFSFNGGPGSASVISPRRHRSFVA